MLTTLALTAKGEARSVGMAGTVEVDTSSIIMSSSSSKSSISSSLSSSNASFIVCGNCILEALGDRALERY